MSRIKRNTGLFTTVVFTFSLSPLSAQERMQEIKAPISSVRVCLNAALISHTQKVKLKTGITKLAFVGLATNIDKNDISLRNIGKGELLSLQLVKLSDTTDITNLQPDLLYFIRNYKDSITGIEKNIRKLTYELHGLQLEQGMLLKNDNIIPNGKQMTLTELKTTTEYYRERSTELDAEIYDKQRALQQMKKNKVKVLKSAFDVENGEESNMNICIIVAQVSNTSEEYSADMELSYLANGSGWIPVYEIYATDNKTVKVNYRAKILNNTGIDWNNQNITITTADPTQYYTAPQLAPFFIAPYDYSNYNSDYGYGQQNNEQQAQQQVQQKLQAKASLNDEEEIFVPDREITFAIPKSYTFPSGLMPVFVDVTGYNLTPDFIYRCAPKKDERVYSVAKVKDWEKLNLLDGEASIYNNGAYLGKAYIKPSEFEDNMELPFGVVSNVFVKHKEVSELSSKKVFSGGINATFDYEIKVKNNTNDNVTVEVIDQVPVSQRSNVKVEDVLTNEGGQQETTTGRIIWNLTLDKSGEKTLSLKYTVSYPSDYSYSSHAKYRMRAVRAKF